MSNNKTNLFGWCLDEQHEGCAKTTNEWYGKVWTCECECHTLDSDNERTEQ